MEAAKEAVKETAEKISEPVINATSSITSNKNVALVFFGYLVVAFIVFVLAYVLYSYLAKKVVQSESYLLPETKFPIVGTEFTKVPGKSIPASGNGKRQTILFWIYINDVDKFKGLYRHIWHRGDKQITTASPLVFMDKSSNKIHVRFNDITPTGDITISKPYRDTYTENGTVYTITSESDKITYDLATHGITLDYIPIQRWVHVAIVVNEEVNGGSIQAFLDGELVKSTEAGKSFTVGATSAAAGATRVNKTVASSFQNLNLDKPGDIYIGGSILESAGPGFSGLVSKMMFVNHDMNVKDIYNIYTEGPIDNLAAKLGMPAYGVRSPIYKIGS